MKILGKITKAHVFSMKSNENVHVKNENKIVPFINSFCQFARKHQLLTIYVHSKIPPPHGVCVLAFPFSLCTSYTQNIIITSLILTITEKVATLSIGIHLVSVIDIPCDFRLGNAFSSTLKFDWPALLAFSVVEFAWENGRLSPSCKTQSLQQSS